MKNILASIEIRQKLLEHLILRRDNSQEEAPPKIQEWINELKDQQITDINSYKNSLLLTP